MARKPGFDLASELAKPSFTPAVRDAAALVELIVLGDEPAASRAAPLVAGLAAPGRGAVMRRLEGADDGRPDDGAAARLVAVIGLLTRAGDLDARAALVTFTRDPRVRVRRAAIVAIGKLATEVARPPATLVDLRDGADRRAAHRREPPRRAGAPDAVHPDATPDTTDQADDVLVELRDADSRRDADDRRHDDLDDVRTALIARWDADDVPPDERRALAETLGKVAGPDALSRLAALDAGDDAELARRRDRALLIAEREAKRGASSSIVTDVAPAQPVAVRLSCRPDLAELLVAELATHGLVGVAIRTDAVDLTLDAPWASLFRARLWASAAIRVPLPELDDDDDARPRARTDALAAAITRTVTSPAVRDLLRAWTRGPIRWRLGVADGHQRALIWRVAKDVSRVAPDLINDPTHTTWDLRLDLDGRALGMVPRQLDDPRFAYRVADLPAASHPSVAAALAWVAQLRPGDRVWDPFCGSGLELIECARRGAGALAGTDVDELALQAARANLDAAGLTATLTLADARTHEAGRVEVIVTNPPLGSRVSVDAAALLVAAVPGFVRQLAPRGRLVWITPATGLTTPVLVKLGLHCSHSRPVDLGGVRGQLERWDRR